MRRLNVLSVLLVILAAPVFAQTRGDRQPLPDVPPPAMVPLSDSLEPQVTIRKRESDTVEEHRMNGKLYKIVVTPEHGAPYTLIDQRGDGVFVRSDAQGAPQLSVPMWVIGTF